MHISIILSLLTTGIATLSFPMEAYYDAPPQRLHKRAGYPNLPIEIPVVRVRVFYNVGTGSRAQRTYGVLTTSFADLVVQTSSNPKCSSDIRTIEQGNGVNCTYAIQDSGTTLYAVESLYPNTWVYGFGSSNTTIKFFYADVTFDNELLESMVIGGITDGLSDGVLGLGYPSMSLQSTYDFDTGVSEFPYSYKTPLQALKSEGRVLSESYSVWLASISPKAPGGVTLGGFDRTRFDGNLTTVPIEYQWYRYWNGTDATYKGYTHPILVVNSVSITNSTGDENKIMDGVSQFGLDFDTELSVFPDTLVDALVEMFHCTYDSSKQYYYCPCGVPDGNLTFNIRGYEMPVPFSSLIQPVRDYNGVWQTQSDGALRCYMPVTTGATINSLMTFGVSILANQYVVVHLETNEIGLAPYNGYNSSAYEIYQIGEREILSATPAPSYSSSYTLSDSTERLYAPTFNVSMSELYSSASLQSVSSAGDATATTTGQFLKDSTMSYARTEILTINGSPSLIQFPGCVFACLLGLLL